MSADISFVNLECPLPRAGSRISEFIRSLSEPWRWYARECVKRRQVVPRRTRLVLGFARGSGEIVSMAFVGLADLFVIPVDVAAAHLGNVVVRPAARGRGVGARTVLEAMAVARDSGALRMIAAVGDQQLYDGFYRKCGFERVCGDQWLIRAVLVGPLRRGLLPTEPGQGELVRVVSCHDLATVQSMCAVTHYGVRRGEVEARGPEEVEEEFCTAIRERRTQILVVRRRFRRNIIAWSCGGSRKNGQVRVWTDIRVPVLREIGNVAELALAH